MRLCDVPDNRSGAIPDEEHIRIVKAAMVEAFNASSEGSAIMQRKPATGVFATKAFAKADPLQLVGLSTAISVVKPRDLKTLKHVHVPEGCLTFNTTESEYVVCVKPMALPKFALALKKDTHTAQLQQFVVNYWAVKETENPMAANMAYGTKDSLVKVGGKNMTCACPWCATRKPSPRMTNWLS